MEETVSSEIENTNLTAQSEQLHETYTDAISDQQQEQQQINNDENLQTQPNVDIIEQRECQENLVEHIQTEQSAHNQSENESKQEDPTSTYIQGRISAEETEKVQEELHQMQAEEENQMNQEQVQHQTEEQEKLENQMETQEEQQEEQVEQNSSQFLNEQSKQNNIPESSTLPNDAAATDFQTEEKSIEPKSTEFLENQTSSLNRQAYDQQEVQQHAQTIMMDTETMQEHVKTEEIKSTHVDETNESLKNQTDEETLQIDKNGVDEQSEPNLELKKDSHIDDHANTYIESEMNKDSDDDKNDLSTINVNSLNNIVSSLIESNSSSNMQHENSCDALSFIKNEQGETSFTNDTPIATGAGIDQEDDENSAVADVIAAVEQACAAKAAAGPQNTPTTPKSATKKKAAPKPSPSKGVNVNSNNSLNTSMSADGSSAQKRRKKDPLAPKAPLNGYLVYFNEERAEMRQKNPNIGFGELTKIIAAKWKELPNEEKQKYISEADLDKERYVKQMADYKKSDAYKQYQKDIVNAKVPRVDDTNMNGLPASIQNNFPFYQQPGHHQSNQQEPNLNWLQQEAQVAGFDIPIFTEEFIEHCKTREHEMRQLRKEIGELEQQNSVLHKHIENMQQSSIRMDNDIERVKNMNNQLQRNIDYFRQNILHYFNGTPLPNSQDYPNSSNIDEYIMRLYSIVNQHEQNPNMNDPSYSFAMHAKSIISKINFNSLFEVA